MNLNAGLIFEDGLYKLTQIPIEAYKTLREQNTKIVLNDIEVGEDSTLLSDFTDDCYEIVSTFSPGDDTRKVGFRLRVGDEEETLVIYDVKNEILSIDRSKSGIILSDQFARASSGIATRNADGTIDLHIFVDRASVEVFASGGTAAGAAQVFPSESSSGIRFVIEGDPAEVDLEVYPLHGI